MSKLFKFVLVFFLFTNLVNASKIDPSKECRLSRKKALEQWRPKMKKAMNEVKNLTKKRRTIDIAAAEEIRKKNSALNDSFTRKINDLLPHGRQITSMGDLHNLLEKILYGKYRSYNDSWEKMEKTLPNIKANFSKILVLDNEYISKLEDIRKEERAHALKANIQRVSTFQNVLTSYQFENFPPPSPDCPDYPRYYLYYLQDSFNYTHLTPLIVKYANEDIKLRASHQKALPNSHKKNRAVFNNLMKLLAEIEKKDIPIFELYQEVGEKQQSYLAQYEANKKAEGLTITSQRDTLIERYQLEAEKKIKGLLKANDLDLKHINKFSPSIRSRYTTVLSRINLI